MKNNDNDQQMDNDILPEAEHLSGKMRNSAAENIKVNIFDVAKVCRVILTNRSVHRQTSYRDKRSNATNLLNDKPPKRQTF